MFRASLVVLLLASSTFAAEPAADAEKLVGFWKPVSILCDGREQLPKGQADDFTLVIKDGEYRLYKVLDKAKDDTKSLATITDVFLIGSGVVGAVSTYLTIRALRWKGETSNVNLEVGANTVRLGGRF